jgi:methenyltetrahydromethanopterin cyclohydrolase
MREEAMSRAGLNKLAMKTVEYMLLTKDQLKISAYELPNKTKVLDCGVNVTGSLEAGRLFSEACMGGHGSVQFTHEVLGPFWLPSVYVSTDEPALACLCAQAAGWQLEVGTYKAMASGPARALANLEPIFDTLSYSERSTSALILLETRDLPNTDVSLHIARACSVRPEELVIMVAPTASIVGSVQVAARVVETMLHKMDVIGYDVKRVKSAFGKCVVAPVAADDLTAMGRTNDAVLYAGSAFCFIEDTDANVVDLIKQLPSSTGRGYGKPFRELLMECQSFYDLDPLLFSTASVTINNLTTGNTFTAGAPDYDILTRSFFGADS